MARDLGAASPLGWSQPGRTTLEIKTGGWRTRRPLYVEASAPCAAACPAGEPIARWVERARGGDWAGAWALIREENPLPAVMGRVCAHPCESACHRRPWDGAVAVNALERFVGDWGLAHGSPPTDAPWRAEHVAVVGGGPAGLACAWQLGRLGYRVRLFEAQPALGGLLRYGIPEYRLPRAVLDRELALLLGPGIEVLAGRRLGRDLDWGVLEAHDAVFLATGAPLPLALGVPGEDAGGVGHGTDFLARVNTGAAPPLGPRLAVVGGGSTAMDVARSARRLGVPSVTVLALEQREDMPALAEEVAQALAEGVEIVNGVGVLAVVEAGGRVTGVAVARASLERAPGGAIRPRFEDGRRWVVGASEVLLAVGQRPDLSTLPGRAGAGLAVGADGALAPRLWAGGDLASAQRTVTHAVGAGTRAARAIHRELSGEPWPERAPQPWARGLGEHVVEPAEINLAHHRRARRAEREERPGAERVRGFAEVVLGLGAAEAQAETRRCFTCGRCVACDTCFIFCPDMAVERVDGGYRIAAGHCKGCGLCVEECPRGALRMVSER